MGQGIEPMAPSPPTTGRRPGPARERLASQIGQHLTSGSVLASCPLLDGEEHVVIQAERGAHASDANASPSVSHAARGTSR